MQAKQQGFTLVELIVVIVILGILAATALPKFIDVAGDARSGVIKAVEASMRSANVMVYGKSAAQSQLGTSGTIKINGVDVSTVCGYLATSEMTGQLDLNPTSDFTITAASGTVQHAKATTAANCQVAYTATAPASCTGFSPTYVTTTSGC